MPVFLKKQYRDIHIFIGFCLLLVSHVAVANFSIQQATTHLVNNVYLLDAQFNYELTEKAIEALHNGVALTLVLTMVIERERYLWNEEITTLKQRYEFKYHVLSKQYILKYLNTGIQEHFQNLKSALSHISTLKDYPLLDQYLIKHKEDTYWISLQIHLDIESLPIPLRPIAYLSSKWRLSSDWYLCPLQQPQ
ncbi:MAG: DUF4390 domain-containing protein [Thiomargarita sp.]|nr:DUF4390 domain-containing protein [Thiomargarita sp.]